MSNNITEEQFQRVLPKRVKGSLTTQMLADINKTISDPFLRENYRDNLLSHANILSEGRYKLQSYIDAVRYISFKLFGDSNVIAYTKTFPDRYQKLLAQGSTPKEISSYVYAYSKTQLVNKILEQTLIPVHILNADVYQQAINIQAELMIHAQSEKVRTEAANSLLNHLKRPETKKIELDIGIKDDKTISDLRATTMELVEQQKLMIKNNSMTAKQVAHSKLIVVEGDSEVIDVN